MAETQTSSSDQQSAPVSEKGTFDSAGESDQPKDSIVRDKNEELKALLSTLNSAAQRLQGLWISFISFGAYLTITVLGTTHRMLFLEEPVKLPVFNLDLPLTSFYLIAPVFFLIFHFYVLVQLLLLARTASAFEAGLDPAKANDLLRMQLDNSAFLQMLAGASPERSGRNAWLIRAIAVLTVVIFPVLLFLLFQLQFLPFHHPWLTMLHRSLFTMDLILLWVLWPAFRRGNGLPLTNWDLGNAANLKAVFLPAKKWFSLLSGLSLVLFAWLIAVYPTESLYANPLNRLPGKLVTSFGKDSSISKWIMSWRHTPQKNYTTIIRRATYAFSFAELIFEPNVDYVSGEPRGFFSNMIVLPDKKFVDDKTVRELDQGEVDLKPGQYQTIHSFRGRDLANAILPRVDLRRSDFTGANLNGANLESASLQRSKFACDDVGREEKRPGGKKAEADHDDGTDDEEGPENSMGCAQLNQARFASSNVEQADFQGVKAQKATFDKARMAGAWLNGADFRGASFFSSDLTSARFDPITADLVPTNLTGATFSGAQLDGANFEQARLEAASMYRARLRGADFKGALLTGAIFISSRLEAASFDNADVQGAQFYGARLQGASFDMAKLDLASFQKASLRGAVGRPMSKVDIRLDSIDTKTLPFETGKFDEWRKDILAKITDDEVLANTDDWLASLKPERKGSSSAGEPAGRPFWDVSEIWQSPDIRSTNSAAADYAKKVADYKKKAAAFIVKLACASTDGPFVARRLILNRRLAAAGPGLNEAAARLKSADRKDCPGGIGLTQYEIERLDSLVKNPPRQTN